MNVEDFFTWFFRVWIFSFGPNSPELLPCTPAKKSMVASFNPKVRSFQWPFKYLRKAISSTTLSNVITALFSITICFAIDTIFSFFVFRSLNCLLMIRPQNDKNFLIAPFLSEWSRLLIWWRSRFIKLKLENHTLKALMYCRIAEGKKKSHATFTS